jgi:hypothetical protein
VNPISPYEQLLADKVQQVPVPDMADAIWATIEQELDKGTPDDDGDDPPSSPKGGGSPAPRLFSYFAGTIIIGAALFTYVLTDTKKETTTNTPSPGQTIAPKNTQQNIVTDSNNVSPVRNKPASVLYDPVAQTDSNVISNPFQPSISFIDSLLNQQVSRVPSDSAENKTIPLVTLPFKPDSIAIDKGVPKKPRGVKGITDDDYKIRTEKKDSSPR